MPPSSPQGQPPLQIWGGIECSHVRIGDDIRDQCRETGHRDRPEDLDLIAGTGIAVLRHPVIWGDVAAGGQAPDFGWHDDRLRRLRSLGVRPIAGLLHHGWGPGDLHPLHPGFVEAFADFAETVALRYPWLRDFTPINEPVTTARFAYLYGHWYPHLQDEGAFLRAVVACAEATAEAMRRVRRHIPSARLVQTEDYGRIFAAPGLEDQADYENTRRFLFLDLMTGRVCADHPFHDRLRAAGVETGRLDRLRLDPCPPDLVGIDHYITSDRFLDLDVAAYPAEAVGGNGRQRYADTAAVHQAALRPHLGFLPRLRELGGRYGLPLAITEAHAGCTREEQVRWLCGAWDAATAARGEGHQVEAVTSWAMLGSIDWDSLLLRRAGHYESGAFDLRDGTLRRTAVADAIAALSRDGELRHAMLDGEGWWNGGAGTPWGLRVSLSGPSGLLDTLAACCEERGIAVHRPRAAESHAHLRVTPRHDGTALRLVLEHPAQPSAFVHDIPHADDLHHRAHLILDRLIDVSMPAA